MDSDKRANAAFLICAYMMLVQKQTPEESFHPLVGVHPPFVPYRDAGYGAATYHITILDCLKGVYKALNLGLIHVENLDAIEYEFYEKVEHGDLNWITDKFIAMACPRDDAAVSQFHGQACMFGGRVLNQSRRPLQPAYKMDDLITLLKERGTTTVVRLNNKTYERKKFIDAGLNHVELYFPDGTTPPEVILKRFLDLVESQPGKTILLSSMQSKLWRMHPSTLLPPAISMLRPPTFPTSTRYPASHAISRHIRNSADQLSAAMGKLHHPKSNHTDFMVLDHENDALETEIGFISMEDCDGFVQVGPGGLYDHQSLVTSAAAAMNMTEMDSYQPIELAEGGGGMYAGYSVPVQPRKQIGSTKREPTNHTSDDWRTTTPSSTLIESSSSHSHASSQPPPSSKNYIYTTRPTSQGNNLTQPTSSQGTQTRYNLRPNTGVPGSRPATQPRSGRRPETSGIEELMVSGDKLRSGKNQGEQQQAVRTGNRN
ncbi:hypothetical protein CcCBS67573_g07984 [Chytriomyces confervae]|uniref:Dual specificity/tyrosine protein phosphatase N-terminal domain-containing protein n=1 Tax=Chytriomyces confervae TaxID=246404 RepID=A0A507ERF1_9FUNG|nr:hypothetical protein CcCBS67573_g07984 [Chytriomyces confervae]